MRSEMADDTVVFSRLLGRDIDIVANVEVLNDKGGTENEHQIIINCINLLNIYTLFIPVLQLFSFLLGMTKNLDYFSFTSPGQHFQSIFCNETAYFTYCCDNDNNDQVLLRKDLLPPLTSPIPLTESRSTSRPRDTSPSVSSWLLLPPGPSCEAGEVCLYCGGAHPSPELAGDGGHWPASGQSQAYPWKYPLS